MPHYNRPKRSYSPVRRVVLILTALVAGIAFANWIDVDRADETAQAEGEPPAAAAPPAPPGPSLADVVNGNLRIVDLAWPLNSKSAYWPGDNYTPFELHTIATLERDGVLSKAFSSPEHLGTHLDAPNHFVRDGDSVDQIEAQQLFAPAVVIDVEGPASADADYRVSLEDVQRFETEHGRIPDGAAVLARTGWSKFWDNPARYQSRDVRDQLHFPGFSAEAVEFLINERNIRGIGVDTMSVDHGLSRDFPVHHLLGQASRWGLENLAALDKLPPRDFFLVVAPMKIETGTGGPARVFALVPKAADGS